MKGELLLAVPKTVTTTLPVVAPVGTVTTMLVALQLVTVVGRAVEGDRAGPLRCSKVRSGNGDGHPDRP